MTDKPDPDELKGPGGLTLRQIHEQVQRSVERDREEQVKRNTTAAQQGRWQLWVRYMWARSGRRFDTKCAGRDCRVGSKR
ncbi:hypothetical protein F6X39_08180 [Paraburkholderia sp. UCT2]|nr:hypothetical protein [Paraburkholderia sp. UCT2]